MFHRLAAVLAGLLLTTAVTEAHVVKQIFAKFTAGPDKWQADVTMDAGYVWPEYRDDPNAPQPTLEWLESRPPKDFAILRRESESLLRQHLEFRSGEAPLTWTCRFPDFDSFPPDFPEITGGGAFLTVRIEGPLPSPGSRLTVKELTGQLPDFVFQTAEDQFPTLEPGKELTLFRTPWTAGSPLWVQSLWWGFTRLILSGWEYALFLVAMTLPDRRVRALLRQFLCYAAGSCAGMTLFYFPGWHLSPSILRPLAALCLSGIAAGNAWKSQPRSLRLVMIGALSLVQGLSLGPELGAASFSVPLLFSFAGVQCAAATVLALWLMISLLGRKAHYDEVARSYNLLFFLAGLALCLQRVFY
jgi:hypothetical protein